MTTIVNFTAMAINCTTGMLTLSPTALFRCVFSTGEAGVGILGKTFEWVGHLTANCMTAGLSLLFPQHIADFVGGSVGLMSQCVGHPNDCFEAIFHGAAELFVGAFTTSFLIENINMVFFFLILEFLPYEAIEQLLDIILVATGVGPFVLPLKKQLLDSAARLTGLKAPTAGYVIANALKNIAVFPQLIRVLRELGKWVTDVFGCVLWSILHDLFPRQIYSSVGCCFSNYVYSVKKALWKRDKYVMSRKNSRAEKVKRMRENQSDLVKINNAGIIEKIPRAWWWSVKNIWNALQFTIDAFTDDYEWVK